VKAISLWQPWASLWLSDAKVHETRHWPTSHRGWLLVHAAKRKVDDFSGDRIDDICSGLFGNHWGQELPFGALIGMVNLVGCTASDTLPIGYQQTDDYECGDFSPGRFAWRRSAFKLFKPSIPYRGMQGIFNVPDNLIPFCEAAP
jgi:activating signal cointegrator 1